MKGLQPQGWTIYQSTYDQLWAGWVGGIQIQPSGGLSTLDQLLAGWEVSNPRDGQPPPRVADLYSTLNRK